MPESTQEVTESTEGFNRLTEKDQHLLSVAGKEIVDKFLHDYPDKLPDAVVLPDKSARPLAYLLMPIFDKVSKERNVSKPQIFFFRVSRIKELVPYRIAEESGGVWETIDRYNDEVKQAWDRVSNAPDEKSRARASIDLYVAQLQQKLLAEAIRKVPEYQNRWRKRSHEITHFLERSGVKEPDIVVFDDYITDSMTTISEIRKAFGENLPAYVFLAPFNEDEDLRNKGVRIGLRDPDTQGISTPSSGFDYRNDIGIGHWKSPYSTSLYAEALIPLDEERLPEVAQAKQDLRKDLHKLGEQIATII